MNNFFNTIRSTFIFTNGHYIQTFITEFFVLLAGLLVYKLAATNFNKEGFAEYALCRRTISLMHPVLLLGFAVGIPRFIAMEKFAEDLKIAGTFFVSGLIISISFSIVVLALSILIPESIAGFFFNDIGMSPLIFPIAVLVMGLVIHSLYYSYFRGKFFVARANIVQFMIIGLVPVLILLFNFNVFYTILWTGIVSLSLSILIVVMLLIEMEWNISEIGRSGKKLLNYGLQRIPGDLMLAAFFAIPAFVIAHQSGKVIGGFVAFSITLIGLVGTSFGPISLLLLPKSAELIVSGNYNKLSEDVSKILKIVIISTVTGLIVFEIFAEQILEIYLGYKYDELILVTRLMILSALGYSIYISLRSVLDAYHVKAVNTINIFYSFLLFIFLCTISIFLNDNYLLIITSFILSISVLGWLTYVRYKKIISDHAV